MPGDKIKPDPWTEKITPPDPLVIEEERRRQEDQPRIDIPEIDPNEEPPKEPDPEKQEDPNRGVEEIDLK